MNLQAKRSVFGSRGRSIVFNGYDWPAGKRVPPQSATGFLAQTLRQKNARKLGRVGGPSRRRMPHAERGKDFGWRLKMRAARDARRRAERNARTASLVNFLSRPPSASTGRTE